ncbi:programmed cell death protein 1 isoform X1 [Myotis daubentonii]|uniref:programmed cell death protein 1 isoform X1 n=1 Tax=Myotis daubentonii TaxID=98922 RepID=UPI00287321BF|nr:programmed cell death protein 1 isoform X1 [Myotis daubentonii]
MGTPGVPWPLLWAVLQLGWRPGWLLETPKRPWSPLTFHPPQLTVAEGETATFTCSFSNTSEDFVLNWYRMSPSNQTDKLAAFPEDSGQEVRRDQRFRMTRLPNGRDFEMSVLTARRNDSGIYFCGAIYLPPKTQIHESLRAELTVTERAPEQPTEGPSPAPSPAGQLQGLVIGVTSVLVGVLLLLLLTWVLATRGGCACRSEDQPPKEGPSVGSVDYGELDFQRREKTPEPPAPCVPEQTEYATIVFPGRPGSPRRASADSPQGPQPLRLEDGHCSWPL